MKDKYTISKAYHWSKLNEVEIKSDNLIYAELENSHHGLQCNSLENHNKILNLCKEVAILMREIDKLNNEQL